MPSYKGLNMKIKERESLKKNSIEELKSELRSSKEKMFGLKFKKASGSLPNPVELRIIRHRIATIKTFIRQKEAVNEDSSNKK